MNQVMYSIDAVRQMLTAGKRLILSGDEAVLSQLPAGTWMGGTIPYFMAEEGGVFTQERIYVTPLPDHIVDASIRIYDATNISRIFQDIPDNGFALIIIPAFSQTHLNFAIQAPGYEGFAARPLIGWISGFFLQDTSKITPKVFNGETGQSLENNAVVMHITLTPDRIPEVDIVNIFEQGDGDIITFPTDDFTATEAMVNGQPVNFAQYVTDKKLDTRLPLVADYYGAQINISIRTIDVDKGSVSFYAPVFRHVKYRQAKPVQDYVAEFSDVLPKDGAEKIFFSCNCILNYLYGQLEGRKTADITGPATFGEIAYQLLNQTLVYIKIHQM